jgi:hypothetical protein
VGESELALEKVLVPGRLLSRTTTSRGVTR